LERDDFEIKLDALAISHSQLKERMEYFENRSFNIGLIICFICGGVHIMNNSVFLADWLIILNGVLALIGFIFLMKGFKEVNNFKKDKINNE